VETVPYSHLVKGTFLIASPDIDTGFYFRSVVLLCEHNPVGSLGIVINKPLEFEIPEEILNLKEVANPRIQIRAGGPIQPNQMMLLHSSENLSEQALKICDGVFLGGDLQFLQEAAANPNGPYLDLCFGYVGWGQGLLEKEFLQGNWFLYPASAKHVFETSYAKLWQTVLREMGGKYATLSMIPEDLTLN
jgi:putative transcriptional regulator